MNDDEITALHLTTSLWPSLDDAARIETIAALCAAGLPGKEIAEALGISEDIIVMIRLRHDIEPAGGKREWARLPEWKRRTIADMTERGCSDHEIAREIGVSAQSVVRHRASYSLPSPRRDLGLHPDTILEILRLQRLGLTQAAIADRLDLHKSTIARLFNRRLGRKWGHHNVNDNTDIELENKILELAQQGRVPSEIAETVDRARSHVTRTLKRLVAEGRLDGVTRMLRSRDDVRRIMQPIQAAGGDLAEAARALGCSRAAAGKWARKLDLKFPDGRKTKRS